MNKINCHQALLGFSYFSKIGPIKIAKLRQFFGTPEAAFFASALELERAGISAKIVCEFIKWRINFNIAKIESELNEKKIKYLTINDESYPFLLREVHDLPYIIYYRGNISLLSAPSYLSLAVIGSRKHSAYGEKAITALMPALIENKIIITSGLALGIDTLAHKITLENGGSTIAVLGSGLDDASIYPPANLALAEKIIKSGGLLISEFPPRTPPLKQNFPRRNRIISGLCQAILVIEADLKSGSLITAGSALDQNRDVLAIPGNIFSSFSRGTNSLLKQGAKIVTCVDDILEIYNLEAGPSASIQSDRREKALFTNKLEKTIYQIIKDAHDRGELITADEIIEKTKLDTAVINSTLSILELRGVAKYDEIGYDIN